MQLSGLVEVRLEPVGDPYNGCADPLFVWSWLNRHPFDWRGTNVMHFNPLGSSGPLPASTCPRCLVAKVPKVDCGPLEIPLRLAYLNPVPEWPNFTALEGFAGFYRQTMAPLGIPIDNVVEFDGWGWETRHPLQGYAINKTCMYAPIELQELTFGPGSGAMWWGWAHPVLCDPSYWPYGFSYTITTDVWQKTYWYIVWNHQGGNRYSPTLSLRSRLEFITTNFLESLQNRLVIDYASTVLELENVTEPQAYDRFNAELRDVRELTLSQTNVQVTGVDITYADLCVPGGLPLLPELPETIQLGAA